MFRTVDAFHFPPRRGLKTEDAEDAHQNQVTVEAFDKRELQGAVRGDSLIGRAELQVEASQLGAFSEPRQATGSF